MTNERGVHHPHERHDDEHQQPTRADAQLEEGVHFERMVPRRHDARKCETPEAHSAHEDAKQHTERNGRRFWWLAK